MTPIAWEWFALRAMWFSFGAVCMFVFFVAIAPVILSGRISAWEEMQTAEPEPEPAPPERDTKLAEAEAKAEFYYRMVAEK